MRIAVVSDIHGNLCALEAVAADLQRRHADQVVNLGDSLSGPLLPAETADYLMRTDWLHLAGNHERQILENRESDRWTRARLSSAQLDWLASLPPNAWLNPEVFLCHGTPRSDHECLLENAERAAGRADIAERLGATRASLVLCGHSHVARIATSGSTLIVNPGSVGHPAYADDHPYPHRIESASPAARYALIERQGAGWSASLISVEYDHLAMARLAEQRQRPDWAYALRTGYADPDLP